ncbi:MAG: type IV pilus twitching motility protein PilT [Marinisporobacter sp.]|jgi:twitching motility protein PilT|nr:type IV pilus twitching motility protein PilT [Marinisporobacter sp.]
MNWSRPYTERIDSRNLQEILEYAHGKGSTDIHLIVDSKPVIRVHKSLEDIEDAEMITPEISKILADSCMSESHKKILEEAGEVDFSFSVGDFGRYRANIFRQKGNYSIALRAIPVDIPNFDNLKLPPAIRSFANKHMGLVLVTGATGSGKSTTLASLLDIINQERRAHIITIEDPIEYVHVHKKCRVNQREIGGDTKSFATALRASLREDPDIILVGEMRDPETIATALTAAETGHLVFSTLHTIGAAKTIDRIIDSFPTGQQNQVRSQLATVLNGVVSQQLIPKMDGTGITAACEVMIANGAIRNLIRENKPHQINSIIQTSHDTGMQSMDYHLSQLVQQGMISKEAALERAQDEQSLSNLLMPRW